MDDKDLLGEISQLADEERELEESHVGRGLSEDETGRLRSIEVALDRCWDLLRQRHARRSAGLDPDEAHIRPEEVVEHYQQ